MKRLTYILLFALVLYLIYEYLKKKSDKEIAKQKEQKLTSTIIVYNVVNDELLKITEAASKRIIDLENQLELNLISNDSVNFGQVVCINNGRCSIYNPFNQDMNDLPVGICKEYGYSGSKVKIQISGLFTGLSNLEYNTKYYAGENGTMTKIVPTSGIIRSVGYTNQVNSLIIDTSQKIEL